MTDSAWLTIKVLLESGRGADLEPPAGRVLLVRETDSLADLAEAIDVSFARWDRSHLHQFTLPDGRRFDLDFGEGPDDGSAGTTQEARLGDLGLDAGERFEYVFDIGDAWRHSCEVLEAAVDPQEVYGEMPGRPVPIDGWGTIPDQYGREEEEEP